MFGEMEYTAPISISSHGFELDPSSNVYHFDGSVNHWIIHSLEEMAFLEK